MFAKSVSSMNSENHFTKFKTIFLEGTVNNPDSPELIYWAKRFQEEGLVPGPGEKKGGNFSFRDKEGFIITPSAKPFQTLVNGDLVKVLRTQPEKNAVYAVGRFHPASESFIHALIYKNFPEINAVFHGESPVITKKAGDLQLPVTEVFHTYGTQSLAKEVLNTLEKNKGVKCIVMRGHGEIYIGEDMKKAGEAALSILKEVRNKGLFK